MTVVVTGASGHIGNNLVRTLLASGRKVRALVHGSDDRSLKGLTGLELCTGDVCDPASLATAFAGAEVVYHLAAHISISDDEDRKVDTVNVTGTRNVVAAAQRAGVRRLVHFSSVHALWSLPKGQPVAETAELADRPDALPYDRSKARAEKAVLAAVSAGLDAVIVNPGSVLGPNDFRPSAQGAMLLDLVGRRLPALVGGGYNWCDVRDVVAGAIAAEQHGRRGERYLLAGFPLTIRQVAALVEKISGVPAPRLTTPLWLAHLTVPGFALAAKLRGSRQLVTHHSLDILASNCEFRIDKARHELGYSPRPISDTIADSLSWYRAAGYQ